MALGRGGGRDVRGGGRFDAYLDAHPHPQAYADSNVNLSEYFKKQKERRNEELMENVVSNNTADIVELK